jgi:hypothetical protein
MQKNMLSIFADVKNILINISSSQKKNIDKGFLVMWKKLKKKMPVKCKQEKFSVIGFQ